MNIDKDASSHLAPLSPGQSSSPASNQRESLEPMALKVTHSASAILNTSSPTHGVRVNLAKKRAYSPGFDPYGVKAQGMPAMKVQAKGAGGKGGNAGGIKAEGSIGEEERSTEFVHTTAFRSQLEKKEIAPEEANLLSSFQKLVEEGKYDKAQKLAEENPGICNKILPDGTTPLTLAARQKSSKKLIEALIRLDANVNQKDSYGNFPLKIAMERQRENVAVLAKNGADTRELSNPDHLAYVCGAKIIQSPAAATYNKKGEIVKEGETTYRLHPIPYQLDTRFDIAIIKMEEKLGRPSDQDRSLVEGDQITFPVKHPEKAGAYLNVTVSVNEMSERLLINRHKLLDYAKSGAIPALLESKGAKIQNLNRIIDQYHLILEKYEDKRTSEGSLIGKLSRKPVGLTAEQMMKVVRAFYKTDIEEKQGLDLPFVQRPWQADKTILLKFKDKQGMSKLEVLAQQKAGRSLQLARMDDRKPLGKGSSAEAFSVSQLDTGSESALKLAASSPPHRRQRSQANVLREYRILSEIHKNGPVPHVQAKPHMVFNVTIPQDQEPIVGFIGEHYDGDLFALMYEKPSGPTTPGEIADQCCKQIIEASAALEKLGDGEGIINTDNKQENIFCKFQKDPAGNITGVELALADWGSGHIIKDINQTTTGVIHTHELTAAQDAASLDAAVADNDIEAFKFLLVKMDAFQKGVILYNLLTNGSTPYPTGASGYLDAEAPINEAPLLAANIPAHRITHLKLLLSPDPYRRPSFSVIQSRW